MSDEESRNSGGNIGPISRVFRMEGLGGNVSEEGNLMAQSVEMDYLDRHGYVKVIATRHNSCDCGHFSTAAGRCGSCQRAVCKECFLICDGCGRGFCRSCLRNVFRDEEHVYCPRCAGRVVVAHVVRRLLGVKP